MKTEEVYIIEPRATLAAKLLESMATVKGFDGAESVNLSYDLAELFFKAGAERGLIAKMTKE